jgi:hypothetical protein
MVSPETTAIEIGTSIRLSARLVAVTVTSSKANSSIDASSWAMAWIGMIPKPETVRKQTETRTLLKVDLRMDNLL